MRTLQKRKLRGEATRKLEADLKEARQPMTCPDTPQGTKDYWAVFRTKIQAVADAIGQAPVRRLMTPPPPPLPPPHPFPRLSSLNVEVETLV